MGGVETHPPIAYVLGNGPSLTPEFLDSIKGHISFAVNRIHLIYGKTEWRPTYYVRTEPPQKGGDPKTFFDECRIHIEAGVKCVFPSPWRETLGEHDNVEYVNTCHHFKYGVDKAPSAWHLPLVCDYGTVVTAAMQIAVLKGYKELRVAGCDLVGGHFDKNYGGEIQTDLWTKAHEIARKSCPVKLVYL